MNQPTPDVEQFVREAETALAAGSPLRAYDVTSEALATWPDNRRLRQLHGLALARSGSPDAALPVLERLAAEGADDEETLGLLARMCKDAALRAGSRDGGPFLERAAGIYGDAWSRHKSTWAGINAATCLMLLGRRDDAMTIARGVTDLAGSFPHDGSHDGYWTEATLGEAALVLEDLPAARSHYTAAAQLALAAKRYGDWGSTRRNARLLVAGSLPSVSLDEITPPTQVVIFTGHRPDAPGREVARFPDDLKAQVSERIAALLDEQHASIGYASAAAGSDLLFIEALLARGGDVHVVLPFPEEEFIRTSVSPSGPSWVSRWRDVRDRVSTIRIASDEPLSRAELSYEYANRLLHGLGRVHAQLLDGQACGLAVWDPADRMTPGGTTAALREWTSARLPYTVIDLAALRDSTARAEPPAPQDASDSTDVLADAVAAFIFCDAVGFSKLRDSQMPAFVDGFLGAVGRLADGWRIQPVLRNTWGDGLFFAFGQPSHAAHFALDLVDVVAAVDRGSLGLPPTLSVRVGVHAGPVLPFRDPITKAPNYFGAHVSRAARIEPITPPGQVFASEPMAALLAASGEASIDCQYAGTIPLAKGYGRYPMYHLARRPQSAPRW